MKNNLPTLDDIVFEHRNKLYGAFELRKSYASSLKKATLLGIAKSYASSLKKATLLGIAALLFVTGSSFIYFKSQPEKTIGGIVLDVENWYEPPVEKEIVKVIPPPLAKAETPPLVKQVVLLPPNPLPDNLDFIEVVPPKVSEMDNALISNRNVDGIDAITIVFDAPPPFPVADIDVVITDIGKTDTPFLTVEIMPEFIGGVSELYKWLGNNLRYPSAAVNAGVEGKVFVKFIVEKDGKISKPEVLKGIGFGCDEEALKSLRKMPNWKPGMQNGKPVLVYFTIPIVFKLQ
jgi:protein TonB